MARTYNTTYLNDANHTAQYILNRVATSTVTAGSNSATLVQNTYDNYAACGGQTGLMNRPDINQHDAGFTTGFLYRGNATSSTTPAGTSCSAYDIGGNTTASTNVSGVTTTAIFSTPTHYAVPDQLSTSSLTTTMGWNSFLALQVKAGTNQERATLQYDGNARPQTYTSPHTPSTSSTTTYSYNDTAMPATRTATATLDHRWTRATLDGLGHTIKTERGANGGVAQSAMDTQYEAVGALPFGTVKQVSQPYDPNQPPGTAQYWTVYTYDGLGRTKTVVAPDGASTTSYLYQGNTVRVTDAAGKWKKFTMDALGNLKQVDESDPALGTVLTTYTYDILNHLTGVSMTRGSTTQTRSFNYTSGTTVGAYLLSTSSPEAGTVTYTYNADHTRATRTDANGRQLKYTYENLKRLKTVSLAGTPDTVLRTFYYDSDTDPDLSPPRLFTECDGPVNRGEVYVAKWRHGF